MRTWPTANWPIYLVRGEKLAVCIAIQLANGTTVYYTDHTQDLHVTSLATFSALAGLLRSAISTSSGLDTSNFDMQANIDNGLVNNLTATPQSYAPSPLLLTDILAGMYRGSLFTLYFVFPDYPLAGYLLYLKGILGEAKTGRNTIKFTHESQVWPINVQIPVLTTPTCRNKFGDTKCQINAASYAQSTTITSLTTGSGGRGFRVPIALNNPAVIAASPNIAALQNVWNFGTVAWTSGSNAGISTEISSIAIVSGNTDILVWLPPGYPIAAGDNVTLTPGCAKSRANCLAWQNVINFNAEPDVPGADLMNDATSLV